MNTAELVRNNVVDQLGRLENVLNVSYLKNQKQIIADCTFVLKMFDLCDRMLSNYDILNKTELGTCYLDKNSSILNDMSCAKDTTHDLRGSQIHGNISREDVVDAINFDTIFFLQEDRYDQSAKSYQEIMHLYDVINTIGSVVLPLLQLLAMVHKYKSLKVWQVRRIFGAQGPGSGVSGTGALHNVTTGCTSMLGFVRICSRLYTFKPSSRLMHTMLSQQKTSFSEIELPIVMATMKCIENCILLNIDALCGTKTHLHGICLFASVVLNCKNMSPLIDIC